MSDIKKKNKLDLDYNRCCQFFNTTIIVLVTIFIGLLLSILTKQIEIGKNASFVFAITLFAVVLIFSIYFLIRLHNDMKSIIRKIDKLKI